MTDFPVFHIPIGRTRRQDGEIVPFEINADQDAALVQWHRMTMCHAAAWAAGACVIIGPTTTSYVDLSARTVTQSRTADGSWLPSALSDFTSLPGGRQGAGFPTARPRCDPRTRAPASSATLASFAVRCPREFDVLMRNAGGQWEAGSRRWLIERHRIGPVIRTLQRTTDPLFRRASLNLDHS